VTTVKGEYGGRCLGELAGIEDGGSEPLEVGVREEIDVEDWQEEELGGGQIGGSVRSQVREESSGEGSGRVLNFEGGLSLARRI
jgi:hypothetical protein